MDATVVVLDQQGRVIERQDEAVAQLRQLAAEVPERRSLVDELLADRRQAASLE
jgi:hypothetical protein